MTKGRMLMEPTNCSLTTIFQKIISGVCKIFCVNIKKHHTINLVILSLKITDKCAIIKAHF